MIEKYIKFRNDIDKIIAYLENIHKEHMTCHKGCSNCCINLSVWPIEYYSIIEMMKRDNFSIQQIEKTQESCCFLKESCCQIYPYRPIICRTHGLPVAFKEQEEDEHCQVSFCEKNFTTAQNLEFHSQNTLSLEEVNRILYILNYEFVKQHDNMTPDLRIPLMKLFTITN